MFLFKNRKSLDMHHLAFGINFLLHPVNLILIIPAFRFFSSQSSKLISPIITNVAVHYSYSFSSKLKTYLFQKPFPP